MALTIQDVIKGTKDKVVQGIVLQFARESLLFQQIPFEGTDSLTAKGWQLNSVTEAVFRQLGSAYTETKDKFTEINEGLYLLGGQIDIDRQLKNPGQSEINVYNENLALQSLRYSYGFTENFINGDRDVDPDTFNGIKKRVEDVGGDQVIAGGSLDLSASSANRQTFLDQLQQAMFEVNSGEPSLVITSKQGMWALTRVARREGLFDTTKDMFDRDVKMFMGVPIMWAGTKGDQTTFIIPQTETAAGVRTGGTDTSFYFVKWGIPNLTGVQKGGPERPFDALTDDGVTWRTVFEWAVGLMAFHDKAAVRYRGVKPL